VRKRYRSAPVPRPGLFIACVVAALAGADAGAATPELSRDDSRPLSAVVDVTVIDAAKGVARPGQTVVLRGGRIEAAGDAGHVGVPQRARVIDGKGKFLIPGLWDMHAHVLWPGLDGFFPLFVANGVTGVRDMGTHFPPPVVERWRDQVRKAARVGPRFVWAGPVVDGPTPVWPGSTPVASEADARRAVRDRKAQGMDFVKVYEFLARDHYFALMDEAKRVGIPVVGHVPQSITAAEASDAGQRCIEHLSGSVDEDGAAELAARFKRNGTWVCPTLAIDWTFALRDDPAVSGRAELKYLPEAVVKVVQLPIPHPGAEVAMRQLRRKAAVLRVMHRAGVPVLAGTDGPMAASVPGFSLHDELRLLVKEAGFTPAEALRAATFNPAVFLGKEAEMGSVEAGKVADLVLLEADPLKDIENVRRIATVIADGRVFDRKDLDRILAGVAADAAANRLDQRSAEELLKEAAAPAVAK